MRYERRERRLSVRSTALGTRTVPRCGCDKETTRGAIGENNQNVNCMANEIAFRILMFRESSHANAFFAEANDLLFFFPQQYYDVSPISENHLPLSDCHLTMCLMTSE